MKSYKKISITTSTCTVIHYTRNNSYHRFPREVTIHLIIEHIGNGKYSYSTTIPFTTFKEARKDVNRLLKPVTPSTIWS